MLRLQPAWRFPSWSAGDVSFRSALAEALGSGHDIVEADSVVAAAGALLAARPAIAFVDLRNHSPIGGAVCRRIKGAAQTRLLPVVACCDPGADATVAALDSGADQVMMFPRHPPSCTRGCARRCGRASRPTGWKTPRR